jgi:hypothetical protein
MINNKNFNIEKARAAFSKSSGPKSDRPQYYPFYKMAIGKSATLRFLPDANQDNDLGFLKERKLWETTIDGEKVRATSLESFGEACPILALSRQFYKANDKVMGKKFWPKTDYMARAIVVKDGLPPDPETGETYTGKVVTLALGKTLYDIISHGISSGELGDDLPCHTENGVDFIINRSEKKGPNGESWSDYSLSKFARSNRALTDDELAVVEFTDENGGTPNFVDLQVLLGKKPTVEYLEGLIEEVLAESGMDAPAPKKAAPARRAAPVEDEDEAPPRAAPRKPAPVAAPAEDEADEAEAFLAQVRASRAAKAKPATTFDDMDDDIPY